MRACPLDAHLDLGRKPLWRLERSTWTTHNLLQWMSHSLSPYRTKKGRNGQNECAIFPPGSSLTFWHWGSSRNRFLFCFSVSNFATKRKQLTSTATFTLSQSRLLLHYLLLSETWYVQLWAFFQFMRFLYVLFAGTKCSIDYLSVDSLWTANEQLWCFVNKSCTTDQFFIRGIVRCLTFFNFISTANLKPILPRLCI